MILNVNDRRSSNLRAGLEILLTCALSLFVFVGCAATGRDDADQSIDETTEAVSGADCGFSISTSVLKVNKKGFKARIKVKRSDGGRLNTPGLSVLVSAGNAQLVKLGHGTFQAVDGGYLLSTIGRDENDDDCDGEDTTPDPDVLAGRAYRFHLKFEGAYGALSTNMMSSGGVACDQAAPTVKFTTSGELFTANGVLNLSAAAGDNVGLAKVVFARDGVELATVRSAPYAFSQSVTSALNGRHRYTATAYDLSGNQASETRRVLVAIGNKFFGTATTDAADYAGLLTHFNQVTPGNAGKWGSVEAERDVMTFAELDLAYQFAKTNHLPFKLHTLVWGSQQPAWLAGLPAEEQLEQLEEWMSALAARYPSVDLVDVVNEPLHAPPSYAAALGGAGATGWDWVIKAFELARAHFPNSELLLNDYAILTLASTTQDYLKLVKLLSDRGLIDGIGEQGHFYERAPELSVIAANLSALTATGLPLYISELDLNFADDAQQAGRMKDLFSLFWSNPSVLGVTHWGYRQGSMWQPNAYLVRTDGSARPALTWIECYRAGGTDCPVPPYLAQPRKGDTSGITLEAEEYDSAHALLPLGNVVAYAGPGSWFGFEKVVFDPNWDTLTLSYAQGGSSPVALEIVLDDPQGAPIATLALPATGDWSTQKTVSIPWAPLATGERNLYARFTGGANVDKLVFSAPAGTGPNLVADGDFEAGTTAGFWSWGGGTIANTTARAASGTHALAMTARNGNSPLVQSLTSTVVPGKTYKLSVRASSLGAASTAYVTTAIQCASDSGATYGRLGGWDNSQTLSDSGWVEFAGELVVPDCALTNVAFWLEGPGGGVDLYLDHVSVRQVTTTNIVPNGTFESGTSGWFSFAGGNLSQASDRAHAGSKSLLVTNRAGNAPAATNLTSLVTAGKSYPFSLWTSLHSPDGSSKALNVTQATTCQAADGSTNTTYDWVAGPTAVADGPGWAQLSGTINVPNCTVTQLLFWVEGGAGADLYVDDVQIQDQSVGPSNLIPDGTFEAGQGGWFGWSNTGLGVTTTSAHGGTHSLLGTGLQANAAIARDLKSLIAPSKRYTATAWVSVGSLPAGSGAVKFQTVQRCNGAANDSYPWLAGNTVSNGAWVQLTGVVDLTSCNSVENLLLFVGADAGDLYVDDVTLTPLP
ncbi:MAG TPA: endo-1,4-beta-xylanase [Polyangiaceae bacterium]|nr:endo-1,4-beta-xylanase [Polyangiaceae bacterium]